MRIAARTLLLFAFFSLVALPSNASTPELVKAVNVLRLWERDSMTQKRRTEIAAALLAYWTSFGERIPRLTPAELAWAKREFATSDSTRIAHAMNRREGALYWLLYDVEYCINAHKIIAEKFESNSNIEARHWIGTMHCYTSSESIRLHLIRSGLSKKDSFDNEFNMQSLSIWHSAIINIARDIIRD